MTASMTAAQTSLLYGISGTVTGLLGLAMSVAFVVGAFFAGVALMENFDVKTRGAHRGTNAMQRAGINLDVLKATDFFSAVGLPEPRISLTHVTD